VKAQLLRQFGRTTGTNDDYAGWARVDGVSATAAGGAGRRWGVAVR